MAAPVVSLTVSPSPPALRPASASAFLARFISVVGYGLFTSTLFGARTKPDVLRARFERFARVSRAAILEKHPSVLFENHHLGAIGMESVRTHAFPKCAVLHLHGGGFVFGSAASYRNRAMRLAHRLDADVFVPDYRLAPEHRFPAALEDAVLAYQYVRALKRRTPVIVTGDSAGGGLALSLLVRLREIGAVMPDGAILLSPWTDLAGEGASVDGNARKDRWLTRAHLERWSSYYAGDTDRHEPLLSPVFAELAGLPPLLVLAGEHEILKDDAERVVAVARNAGTDARLFLGKRMQHDFPLTLPWLAESRDAWTAMAEFVRGLCPPRRQAG